MGSPRSINALRWKVRFGFAALIYLSAPLAFATDSQGVTGTITAEGDGYGNLETDIPISALAVDLGQPFSFTCKEKSFNAQFVGWYSDVAEGEFLGRENERGTLEIAVNNGDANAKSGCTQGDTVALKFD